MLTNLHSTKATLTSISHTAMVVVTSTISSSFHYSISKLRLTQLTSKPSSSVTSLFYIHHIYKITSSNVGSSNNGVLSVKAYMENPNSVSNFVNKVIGALPIVGLLVRIASDEGGVGGDIIDFAEFRRRVGNKCTIMDSKAFYEFRDRRGKPGDPSYVLLCCWLAAVGAGLLKSEEILEGVARLRISDDIEFEEETFIAIMNEARERRSKMKVPNPDIPMMIRAEKALEAIYVCCFGRDPIDEEDEKLLCIMLNAVFPSVGQSEMATIVSEKAKKVAEGGEENNFPEPTALTREAIKLQMKDLQFLQQNDEK